MSNPLVSIIIPVYNGQNFLREAINCALAQTYPHVEVIVVNDGSCDDGATERIALSYGDDIRYFPKENGGVATALNLAIGEMKGEYFSWLSHDDMYYPQKIEKQIQALREHGDMTAVVLSDYDLLDVKSLEVTHMRISKMYQKNDLTNSVMPVLMGLIHGCCLLIHKNHFERVGVFDESLLTTQDYDLWFRMMRFQRSVYVEEPLVLSRVHNQQGSQTLTCYQTERSNLYMNFLKSMTEQEMCAIFGNAYNFYHRMALFSNGTKMDEPYHYANQKLQGEGIPGDLSSKLRDLRKHINRLSKGNANRICIFGAGEYGTRLYKELRSKMIIVDKFTDNNEEKWGLSFENVECISPEQIHLEKESTLIIVANRNPSEIEKQLKTMGFPYITTKQEIDRLTFHVPPVKWTSALETIE